MPIFVKRSKGIKIICRGMPEVFNVTVLLSVLGNWEILKFDRICMQCFFYNRQSESIAKALHVYRLLASPIY